MMPQLLLCTLCDDVRFEVGNKHTLVGLFDTFNVSDFAQPLPPFRVFARLAVDAPGSHKVLLLIQHVETDFRVEVSGRVDARQPSEVTGRFEAIFSATLPAIRLPGPGRYHVRFTIGDIDIGGCAFLVHEMTRPVLQ